jgi:hypothetical protein
VIRGLRVPVHLTSREALRILDVADIWAARTKNDVRLVSANDHTHSRGSAHYQGRALDFHSSDLDGLAATFRHAGYHVLWRVPGHHAHVHVEDESSGAASHPLYGAASQSVVPPPPVARRRPSGTGSRPAAILASR